MHVTFGGVLALLVALAFIVFGLANLAGPVKLKADYARWGYPASWHLVTGGLELAAGVFVLFPQTRLAGAVLAALICLAALATLLRHREWSHTPPSLILLVVLGGLIAVRFR